MIMSIETDKAKATKERFYEALENVVELHGENLTLMMDSAVYMKDVDKKELPSISINKCDYALNLALTLFQEGDGNWGIQVSALWDRFNAYPLAYIRTKHCYYKSDCLFKDEFAELRAVFYGFSEDDLKEILSQTYVNIIE